MKNILTCWAIVSILLPACKPAAEKHTITRGFYYWKSIVDLNTTEQQALDTLQVQKLYIKFFDVAWDATTKQPLPVAKARINEQTAAWLAQKQVEIIPTVFITNESMLLVDSAAIPQLATRIEALLQSTAGNLPPATQIRELQMDCDWTASTKNKYFLLLKQLQALPWFQQKTLSATIRLYQCKYKHKTGVPPVPRGLLMCYNMGNLKNPQTHNSILEAAELEKYIGNLNDYPLPLDVALPLFDWKVLYEEGVYKGLIQGLPDSLLQAPGVAQQEGNKFTLLKDTTLQGYPLKKGAMIRQEDANFAEIINTTRLLRSKLVTTQITVALYHLDSLTLHKYSTYELEEIYHSLH